MRTRPTTNFDQVPVMKSPCFNPMMFGSLWCSIFYFAFVVTMLLFLF